MNREMVFSLTRGGEIRITWPDQITQDEFDDITDVFALTLKAIRRTSVQSNATPQEPKEGAQGGQGVQLSGTDSKPSPDSKTEGKVGNELLAQEQKEATPDAR